MIKFLVSKNLLYLVDYSASSINAVPDASSVNIDELLSTLRQCPNYQIDKNHTNCGPRVRIGPILDYIQSMLSASVVSLSHAEWKNRRETATWVPDDGSDTLNGDEEKNTFLFTRSVANDQRLRYEGGLYVDKMAKRLFTSEAWNWTPEA